MTKGGLTFEWNRRSLFILRICGAKYSPKYSLIALILHEKKTILHQIQFYAMLKWNEKENGLQRDSRITMCQSIIEIALC